MIKKVMLILCLFLLTGCQTYYINNLSYEEIIKLNIENNKNKANINNKGYKYYLPSEFNVIEDDDYTQTLLSNNIKYYLNVDIVAYYYKNSIEANYDTNDYVKYNFNNNDLKGYLKITQNNNNFYIELCYNYAIIEVEVEENDIRYAISRSIQILNSIEYNDLFIEKYIGQNLLETSETLYNIPSAKEKENTKHVLEFVEDYAE